MIPTLLLIFDFDGVIADSLLVHWNNFREITSKSGISAAKSIEEYKQMCDTNFFDSLASYRIPNEKMKALMLEWKSVTRRDLHKILLYPGIVQILRKLSMAHMLYLVSSNYRPLIIEYLEMKNINLFKEVIGSDNQKSKVLNLRMIRQNNPGAEIYYICDTKGDIAEAREAGVKSMAVGWGWHNSQKLLEAKPDYFFPSMVDFDAFFNKR